MGCCASRQEKAIKSINDAFEDLNIRKDTIPEFHQFYEENIENKKSNPQNYQNSINENEFQFLINEKLLRDYDNSIMNDFWFSFYKGIQFIDRLLYIKFILSFFCKGNKNKSSKEEINCMGTLLKKIKKYKHPDLEEEDEKFFYKEELIDILSFYIELITTQTIDHFKYMFEDSEKFVREKKEEWNSDYIRNYIYIKFFHDLEIVPNHKHSIIIDNFLKENIYKLRDGENIRKEFARFCPEYRKAMMNKDFPEE